MKVMKDVKESLAGKNWFRSSSVSVQERLLSLGDDCLGFLDDLAKRPDIISNVRVLSMIELLIPDRRPIFGIFPIFLVQRVDDPSVVYAYQYFTWRQGADTGTKGLLFVERENEVTHIILCHGEKFATGVSEYSCFGGFGDTDELHKLTENFRREVVEELGLSDLRIDRILDLGRVRVDSGMSPQHPHIYVGIINGKEVPDLRKGGGGNLDKFELEAGIALVPIEKAVEFVKKVDDGYFLACIVRYAAMYGKISLT